MNSPKSRAARPCARAGAVPAQATRTRPWARLLLVLFVLAGSAGLVGTFGGTAALAATFLERAQEYVDNGDLGAATVELKNALQRDPNSAEARFLLGKVYLKLGDAAAAVKELQRAKELGLSGDELDLMLAYARISQGRFNEVISNVGPEITFETEIQRDLFVARGEALLGLGQFEQAEAIFDRALSEGLHERALLGKAQIVLARGELQEARRLAEQGLEKYPNSAGLMALQADLLFRAGELEAAREGFARAITLGPAPLGYYLGEIYAAIYMGDQEGARALLDRLAKGLGTQATQSAAVNIAEALWYLLADEPKRAVVRAEAVLGIQNDHPQALLISGIGSYQQGNYEIARTRLSTYLSRHPGNRQVQAILSAALLRLNQPQLAYDVIRPEGEEIPDSQLYQAVLGAAAFRAGDSQNALTYRLRLLEQAATATPANAEVLEQLGTLRLIAGDQSGGQTALLRAIELEPDRLSAHTALYTSYFNQKRLGEAMEAAKRIQSAFPENADGFTMAAMVHMRQDEMSLAQQSLQRAYDVDPDSQETLMNLVTFYRSTGDADAARNLMDSVLREDPGNLDVSLAYAKLENSERNTEKAERLLRDTISAHPEEIRPRVRLGILLVKDNRPLEALAVAESQLADHPDDPGLLEVVGLARLNSGDYQGAIGPLDKLVRLAPNQALAHSYLAEAHERSGNLEKALAEVERVLELSPGYTAAEVARVRYLAGLGRRSEAKAALATLKQEVEDPADLLVLESRIALLDNRRTEALALLQEAFKSRPNNFMLLELTRGQFLNGLVDDAFAGLREWLRTHPQDLLIRRALAGFLMGFDRKAEALAEYEVITESAPEDVVALNNLAWLRLGMGRTGEAITAARRAHQLQPDNIEVADTLALALKAEGQLSEALKIFREVITSERMRPDIRFHFAQTLAEAGEADTARRELKLALADGQEFSGRADAEALLEQLGN